MRIILIYSDNSVVLSELAMGASAVVLSVIDSGPDDVIAQRLRDLGFVAGEPVRLVARGPLGGEPLLIHVGYTRFALRFAEAARVQVAARNDDKARAAAPTRQSP